MRHAALTFLLSAFSFQLSAAPQPLTGPTVKLASPAAQTTASAIERLLILDATGLGQTATPAKLWDAIVLTGGVDTADITGLSAALAAKAPLASPALTGTATAANLTVSGILDTGASGSILTENIQIRSTLDDWTATFNADSLTGNRILTIADNDGTLATREWAANEYVSGTATRASNTFLAGPADASTQSAEFRTIHPDDLSPTAGGTATATNLLHGNMTWGPASLTADVTGTLPVANGGTGIASTTAFALIAGGTTSTGAFQPLASLGTSGQVLTSNGAGALPTWQTSSASPGGSTTQLQRNIAGAFGGISGATSDGTNVTYGSGNLLATSPKITTQLCDANGNPWLLQTATASAVYGARLTNAAVGGTVLLEAQAATQAAAGIAGIPLTVGAANATAGSSTAGAVVGGALTLRAGNAARLTSGDAVGGSVIITSGTAIGNAAAGAVNINGAASSNGNGSPGGAINLTGGAGGSGPSGRGGDISLTSGADTSGSGSGNLTLTIASCSRPGTGNFSPGVLSLIGPTWSASTSATGTCVALPVIAITGGTGGATTAATGVGGLGGGTTITLGGGGSASGNTSGTGGAGGAFTVAGGTGGAVTGTGGTHIGGAGSAISLTSGNGGAATSASGTRTGGNSGTVTIGTGNGGNGTTTNGSSAALTLATGTAGAGAGAAGSVGSIVLSPGGTAGLTVSATSGIVVPKTISGTTGNQTIDKASGAVLFANGSGTAITVTSNLVTTTSIILATVASNDATLKSVAVVAGSGSFVIYPNAAPTTADCRVNFLITN